jgi:hypothetical protein
MAMSSKYRAEQNIAVSAWDSGTEIEIRMVVNFTVHPGYPATLEEPGCGPIAEVDRVQFFEVKDGKPSPDERALPVWLIDGLTEGDDFHNWLLTEAAEEHEYRREQHADMRLQQLRDEREGF